MLKRGSGEPEASICSEDRQRTTSNRLFAGLGMSPYPTPLKGGVLGPSPTFEFAIPTNGTGGWTIPATWPAGVPSGTELYLQYWYQNLGVFAGAASTNTVGGVTP